MGQLRELEVVFDGPPVTREAIVVLLVDGPCAGRYEETAGDGELWARVGKPGRIGVETQMWSRYDQNPFNRLERFYSGITITTGELEAGMRAAEAAGHTHGESYGV